MRLVLHVDLPMSAEMVEGHDQLVKAAYHRQGITITTATGYKIDGDLVLVESQGALELSL